MGWPTDYLNRYSSLITPSGTYNQILTQNTASTASCWVADLLKLTGKWYWEIEITTAGANATFGVAEPSHPTNARIGLSAYSWSVFRSLATTLRRYHDSSYTSITASTAEGDVIGVAVDVDNGKVWFSINGAWIEGDPATGTTPTHDDATITTNGVAPAGNMRYAGDVQTFRPKSGEQSYAAPSGFTAIGGSTLTAVQNHVSQAYGAGMVQNESSQVYGIKLQGTLTQPYHFCFPMQNQLSQDWGIKLQGVLAQSYSDGATVSAILKQYYSDCALPQAQLIQRYNDALEVKGTLEQPYNFLFPAQATLKQLYATTDTEVQAILTQMYNLHLYEPVQATLAQPWIISAAASYKAALEATISVGGRTVDPYHMNLEIDYAQYPISCEMHFHEQKEWQPIARHEEIIINVGGTEYTLIVEAKRRTRRHGNSQYIVEGASKAILMDEPYATPILRSYPAGLPSVIAQSLATPFGLTVDWQIIDERIPADTLYANNETPMAILRRLANQLGGAVQCQPDGTIAVRYWYPTAPAPTVSTVPNWDTVTPSVYLTDMDDFFQAGESNEIRSGQNKFLVGNRNISSSSTSLEEELISSSRKKIKAQIVPWADIDLYTLITSRDNVTLEPLADIEEELTETIEFVNGTGRTSKPIFEVVDSEWLDTQLGAVTPADDGTLTADVKGHSLLEYKYKTKYLAWQADDPRIEDVQFILLKDDDVVALYPGAFTFPGFNTYPGVSS